MSNTTKTSLDLSWWSIIKVVLILATLYVLFLIRDIIAILFLVFIFVAAINPLVTRLQKRMPRLIAVSLIYLAIIALFAVSSSLLFQPLVSQLNLLAQIIPQKIAQLVPIFDQLSNGRDLLGGLASGLQQFSGTLANFSGNVIQATLGVFGGLFTLFTILVLTFYLLLEERALKEFLDNVLADRYKERVVRVLSKISDKMGAWVRGQLFLVLIIFLLDLIVFISLGVQSPLPLAIWGGVMEIVPYLGPILAGLPAVIVALVTGTPLQALLVALLMILIQQLEGQFLVPKVMQRAVGLSPVIVIIALLVGSKLFGIVGALISVPVAAIMAVLVQEWTTVERTLKG